MENVFYLFPVKEGLPDSYAHPILQRAKDFDEEDVSACLRDVCNLDDILQCVTRNKQSFYFSDNVKDFSAGIKNEHDYPTPLTRIRRRFSRQMSDASFGVEDAGENCSVFQSPVSGKDLFARIVCCDLSGKVEGSSLCVLPVDSNNQTIEVRVSNREVSLDARVADLRTLVDWLSGHHHPSRIFAPNPKHDYEHRVKGGSVASKWPFDDATSQSYLDKAFVDGKRLVYCCEAVDLEALVFDEHEENHFHGHVDVIGKVSNSVQRLLKSIY